MDVRLSSTCYRESPHCSRSLRSIVAAALRSWHSCVFLYDCRQAVGNHDAKSAILRPVDSSATCGSSGERSSMKERGEQVGTKKRNAVQQ